MSGEQTREQIAEVLAAHRQVTGFDEVGVYFKYACACSWHGDSDAAHDGHVAAAIAAAMPDPEQAVREAQAAAWDEGYKARGVWAMNPSGPRTPSPNPYREARP